MVVIAKSTLVEFTKKNPTSTRAVMEWYEVVQEADWANFNELKNTNASADFVGNDRYVFNIKGNHFRLIAMIHFSIRTVYIKFIGTHKEYDRIDAKNC